MLRRPQEPRDANERSLTSQRPPGLLLASKARLSREGDVAARTMSRNRPRAFGLELRKNLLLPSV
jgi:hypothetical protein